MLIAVAMLFYFKKLGLKLRYVYMNFPREQITDSYSS